MKEKEVKIIDVNIKEIKEKLLKLGAKKLKNEFQENYFFNLPISKDGYIRIRKIIDLNNKKEKILLTSKIILCKNTIRQTLENEVEISSLEDGIKFLESIGINLVKKATKYRESYHLNEILIEFDEWNKEEFPYPYIEIEADDENKIFKLVNELNIDPSKVTSKTLDEIKKDKGLL
ncbi:adenylate cyclase, class 2 [Caloramator fervidus]|uniref:Adenylate cyclase, class 2 n=1 Tax=Caloramator fervidus TaxID=29344 RepID=A0A1H5SM83_9CLOT|nr:CYTH domain-containing protein [Caloramator fervidus]SEF51544.1 adenylate cyclase, class 2 [Caloramator fervidus]